MEHQLAAARFSARAKGSISSPILEAAPGIGFTNSNFLISQSLDFAGLRSAERKVGEAESAVVAAQLTQAKAETGVEALQALTDYLLATELLEALSSDVQTSRDLFETVRKQVETGEVPQIRATRAEIDALRAEQAHAEARRNADAKRAALTALVGEFEAKPESLGTFADAKPALPYAVRIEQARRDVAIQKLRAAGKAFAPEVSVGVASDIWSLDQRRSASDEWGFQAVLRIPLVDLGIRRNSTAAQRAETSRAESELEFARARAQLELDQAKLELESAQRYEAEFASGLLPKAEQVVQAMAVGYQTGATTLIEILEARQTRQRIQLDLAQARHRRRLSEIRYQRAAATIPGIEVPNP